jgi:adenine-specific DNA methylase
MASNSTIQQKINGIYYTPSCLAEYLVAPIVSEINTSIFDPAYGDGALLLAANRAWKKNHTSGKKFLKMYGCDIAPLNTNLNHVNKIFICKKDFFDYPMNKKFDAIVMNPPYVRHHIINRMKKTKYFEIIRKLCNIKLTSDLWAYFLLKSAVHLKVNGSIGVILPWSFLQANYSQEIRRWLSNRFRKIRVLALGGHYFDKAHERILLVWLEKYGQKTKSIHIAFSKNLLKKVRYVRIKKSLWKSQIVTFNQKYYIHDIIRKYQEDYDFVKLSDCTFVKIGVVTGANKFFIMTPDKANSNCFGSKDLIPIFTTFRECSHLSLYRKDLTKRLLLIPKCAPKRYLNYIREGENREFHSRAHALRRKPWYSLYIGEMPDAFFPYRISHTPYMIFNRENAQCTNSIHRIYFKKNLSERQQKWIQISLLSIPGQLSLEYYSKIYGSGVLKIEPGSLKNSIIHIGVGKIPDSTYNKIDKLVAMNNKKEAVKLATEFINDKLSISRSLSSKAKFILKELQNRRSV